jgi:hypothetical protein
MMTPASQKPKVYDFGFSLGFFRYSARRRVLACAGQATSNTKRGAFFRANKPEKKVLPRAF